MARCLRPIRTIAWLCLLLQLGGAASAFEAVLCVASDGHIAVEAAHAGTCETEARRHHDDREGLADACGDHPCTDIALGETAWRTLERSLDGVLGTPALIALLPPPTAVATAAASPADRAAAGPDPRLVARRTVVLRN